VPLTSLTLTTAPSCHANVTPSFHLPLADKIFCNEQRPFLPVGLRNAERERLYSAPPITL
jgi:hypothetical protein